MATLPACIDALLNSSRKVDEIIIFDDGLNPGIGKLAKRDLISVVNNNGMRTGQTRGRNLAARYASSDILAFVDADVVVEKEALARLVAALGSEADVVASFGSYDAAPPGTRLAGIYVNLRHHWIHQQGDRESATFWTGLGVVRAETFRALAGFDENSSIEDIDFGMRLHASGKRIRFVPDAQGTHLKDWDLLQLWRTDVVNRAFPWSLLIARGARGNLLNASLRERFSAIVAYGFVLSLLGSFATPWLWVAVAIFAGLYIFRNRGLFRLIARRGGLRALFVGISLHWLYHIYASAIFAAVHMAVKAHAMLSRVAGMLTGNVTATRVPREWPPHG
jgi:glycosyltransferase involved in cell wall biosynthesis